MQKIIDKLKELQIPQREISWLLSELNYQSQCWNKDTTSTGGIHDVFEFATFIADYNREMIQCLSRNGEPMASSQSMHTIRKIAAMCVAALYQSNNLDYLKNGYFDDHTFLKNPTHAANLINHFLIQIYDKQLFMSTSDAYGLINFIFNVCLSLAKKTKVLPKRIVESQKENTGNFFSS